MRINVYQLHRITDYFVTESVVDIYMRRSSAVLEGTGEITQWFHPMVTLPGDFNEFIQGKDSISPLNMASTHMDIGHHHGFD